jgi:tRNA dimethylallyltransferase
MPSYAAEEGIDSGKVSVLQQQVEKLSGKDWYRLRRILEVAYTASECHQDPQPQQSEGIDEPKRNSWEELYTGERSGGLASKGYDVRCFFLCPSDRMQHTQVVDERCEDMVRRGLLRETAELYSSGRLPDMVAKAIGYRQALEYLTRPEPNDGDEEAFQSFMDSFTSATRRYSRKQMLWFRKDTTFVFVPVDVLQPKVDRAEAAARQVDRMIRKSRLEYDAERTSTGSISEQTRRETELQAKRMKTYQRQIHVLRSGSEELASAIRQADECTSRVQPISAALFQSPGRGTSPDS